MLMVKIESYAIGSAFERGQARGRRLFARIGTIRKNGFKWILKNSHFRSFTFYFSKPFMNMVL